MPINRLNSGYSGYLSGQSESSEHLQVRSDTFYGRLGSVRDTGHATTPTRRKSFSQQSSLRRISVRLSYDEDAYPGGLDIDMFALLYDTSCTFVDCIFYKHPEDASGSFSLNQKTNSLAIDLESVPDSCHTIVLAAAVYTTGMSITELDGGIIEIFEGFMGPTLISIELQSLDLNGENGSDAAGFVFLALSEFGGKWRCRRLERFCKPELPVLMKVSKEESQQLEEDFAMGNLQNLRTLDFAAKRMEVVPDSGRVTETSRFSPNTSKLGKLGVLQSRLSSLAKQEKDEGERKTVARLSAVEAEQQRMSRRLMNIEDKLDMLLDALK
ncbi:hypothetical protein cyc_05790 [Cyclospora cayetanensis]|uniref:TerD domain-containing protein n=1 Tax=Cyclospora cayetanensis TaxID=88456 RepID=A0A1D3D7C7_9EIME|nr:hypothetical protein cyc_05790 [Cyclospora cayetanensis]